MHVPQQSSSAPAIKQAPPTIDVDPVAPMPTPHAPTNLPVAANQSGGPPPVIIAETNTSNVDWLQQCVANRAPVVVTASGQQALALASQNRFSVVIVGEAISDMPAQHLIAAFASPQWRASAPCCSGRARPTASRPTKRCSTSSRPACEATMCRRSSSAPRCSRPPPSRSSRRRWPSPTRRCSRSAPRSALSPTPPMRQRSFGRDRQTHARRTRGGPVLRRGVGPSVVGV